MKLRSPLTLEGALCKAKDILGAPVIAEMLRVSDSMIYKMCDAEHVTALRGVDIVALDQACMKKMKQAPFADYFQYNADQTPAAEESRQLALGFIEFQAEAGNLSNKLHDLIDNNSHTLRQPSKRDAIEIQRIVDDVVRTAEHIKHDVSVAGKVA
jgi:hypothetical protein